jgi:hypothetical protein
MKSKTIKKIEVNNTEENYKICMQGNCDTCPSFCGQKGEGLFCARGPSKVTAEKKGCNCPECPIWINYGLSNMYYCIKPNKK